MENQMRVQYEYCEYTVLMLVEQQQWQWQCETKGDYSYHAVIMQLKQYDRNTVKILW